MARLSERIRQVFHWVCLRPRVGFWVFTLLGVWAIAGGAWDVVQSFRCAHWPVTEGVIKPVEMERPSNRKGSDSYSAVSYEYQVARVHYTGTRLAIGEMPSSLTSALKRYPVGQKVTVHYAPNDPEQAVLETGVHERTWSTFVGGAVLLLAGVMCGGLVSAAQVGPWIFMLAGVMLIAGAASDLVRSFRRAHWPVTEGVIKTAEMRFHSAAVSYDYQVAGVHYTGTRLGLSSSPADAQGILERYPVGEKVPVHYAPDNPKEAVLETVAHGDPWPFLGIGTLFLLVGAVSYKGYSSAKWAAALGLAGPDAAGMQGSPILGGVLFVLAGLFVCLVKPTSGRDPHLLKYAWGGLFVLVGIFLWSLRLKNKLYSRAFGWAVGSAFLVCFNWAAFMPDPKTGCVRWDFAVPALAIELLLVAFGIRQMMKKRRQALSRIHAVEPPAHPKGLP